MIQKETRRPALPRWGALLECAWPLLGRGPIVDDVVAFTLVDAEGALRRCSREENAALFRLVIGGYGLFGRSSQYPATRAAAQVRREVTLLAVETM